MNKIFSEKNVTEILFESYYIQEFCDQHKEEIASTSPYAVTKKQPSSRIVDNPITKGSLNVNTAVKGFLGLAGSSTKQSGHIDTTVQFDEIFLCPVTRREFLKKTMDEYKKDWSDKAMRYAQEIVYNGKRANDISSNSIIFIFGNDEFLLGKKDFDEISNGTALSNSKFLKDRKIK